MATLEFDAVIIGAGHNALVLAGYLAKSGLQVAVLERTPEIGGGLGTVPSPFVPGFYHEYHSQFHRNIPNLPWFHDLELDRYGVEYIYPPVNNGMPLSDGRCFIMHVDPEITRRSIARLSPRDAEAYYTIYHQYREMARAIWFRKDYSPPLPPDEEAALLQKSNLGREYLGLSQKSAYEMVHELFESTELRAFYLYLFACRGYLPAPTVAGTGFAVVAMTYMSTLAMLARGGSRSLAHALGWMIAAHGGRIFPSTEVARVIIEHDTATGVETVDGRTFRARKVVASSVDPTQTFLRLVGEAHLDGNLIRKARGYKYGVSGRSFGVLFTLHAATHEPPRYTAAAWDPLMNEAFNVCIGYETPEQVLEHLDQVSDGVPPPNIGLQAVCPTLFDPARAPDGKHVLLAWQFAPYALADGGPEGWDSIKGDYLTRALAKWAEYAPNLAPDGPNVIYQFPVTPLDVERHLINMREGDQHVGAYIPQQLGFNRPFPEVSNYRTPIKNLYLTGSGTHPGGNVTGAPGYNTARVVAQDLGLDLWWTPPDPRRAWSELA